MRNIYVFDDAAHLEANEWLAEVKRSTEKEPLSQLFDKFKRESTVSVVNRANSFMKKACTVWESFAGDAKARAEAEDLKFRHSCGLYVYYRVLQGMLAAVPESEPAAPGRKRAEAAAVTRIAADEGLQLSLLNCAAELVSFACEKGGVTFPHLTCALERLHESTALWRAADLFRHHLSARDFGCALPESIASFLAFVRVRIAEQLAWVDGSSLYSVMLARARKEETELFETFLASVGRLAASRVRATAAALRDAVPDFGKIPDGEGECLRILDELMVPNLDLLFNQHLSNLVACCVYGAARKNGVVVSFKRLTRVMLDILLHHSPEIFQQAEIGNALGDTRRFYNDVFLPRMQGALEPAGEEPEKQQPPTSRIPLRALTANDMNTRGARPGRVAAMQK